MSFISYVRLYFCLLLTSPNPFLYFVPGDIIEVWPVPSGTKSEYFITVSNKSSSFFAYLYIFPSYKESYS